MPFRPFALHRRPHSLAAWIAGVSLLALLPLLVFAVATVYRHIVGEQERAMQALQRRTANAAELVARELGAVHDALRILAQADGFQRGDRAAMYQMAQRVVALDRRLVSISITDADGRIDFATSRPFGTALPRSNLVGPQRRLFEHGETLVSPLITGAVTRQRVVLVAIPLQVGAQRLALRASVRLEAINRRLNEERWPPGWVVTAIDQNHVIVARSRDAERYVGQPITASLRQGVERRLALVEATTQEGIATLAGLARVPGTDWMVAVGLPRAALTAQLRSSLVQLLAAGVFCALLGIGGAVYLARYLGRQLRAVVQASLPGVAAAGVAGAPPPRSAIREINGLAQALAQARGQAQTALAQLEQARRDTLAQLTERSEMLDVLAHEVRQPLHNASAALQAATAAQAAGGDAATARRALARAHAVISEVQANINNTLAAAALLVGTEPIWQDDTDIDALIAVAIGDLPPRAAGRVRVERATATRTATMNASLMRLALRNLLSNALAHSPPEAPIVVRLSDSDEPLALLIDVVDQGGGIPEALLPGLFERPGRQGPPPPGTPRRRKGLGLYIVRRVMDLHGGAVQVLRHGPEGTTMRLVVTQGGAD